MSIEFEKTLSSTISTSLRYNYNVIDNGEFCGVFKTPMHGGRGYYLFDRTGRPIHSKVARGWERSPVVSADKKADFLEVYLREKAAGNVPTLAHVAERDKQEEKEQQAYENEKAEVRRMRRIQEAAPELLDALEDVFGAWDEMPEALAEKVAQVIRKAKNGG